MTGPWKCHRNWRTVEHICFGCHRKKISDDFGGFWRNKELFPCFLLQSPKRNNCTRRPFNVNDDLQEHSKIIMDLPISTTAQGYPCPPGQCASTRSCFWRKNGLVLFFNDKKEFYKHVRLKIKRWKWEKSFRHGTRKVQRSPIVWTRCNKIVFDNASFLILPRELAMQMINMNIPATKTSNYSPRNVLLLLAIFVEVQHLCDKSLKVNSDAT